MVPPSPAVWSGGNIAAADAVGPGPTGKILDARWRPGTRADVAWVVITTSLWFTYATDSSHDLPGQAAVRICPGEPMAPPRLNEMGRVNFIVDLHLRSGYRVERLRRVIAAQCYSVRRTLGAPWIPSSLGGPM